MKVALLVVATGKYDRYLHDLIASVNDYFMVDCEVDIHIFSDKQTTGWFTHKVEHRPHPYPTLMRYHFFKKYESELKGYDYLFYMDVDCLIKSKITTGILSARVVVQHCGFLNQRGSYETNQKSTSYVAKNEGTHYFGGGFWGFSNTEFWKFINKAVQMLDEDFANNIIPEWHDESVLNRYMIDNPPTKILPHSFHYPEGQIEYYRKLWMGVDYEPVILLLDKNHEEVRK